MSQREHWERIYRRHSPEAMHAEFGAGSRLLDSVREEHHTPWGATQAFIYCLCRADGWARRGSRHLTVDRLTLFGLFAVTAMLVTYALEARSSWFILAFAGACVLGSVYGFLQGAWPFGVVEAVWAGVALRRWWTARPVS